MQHQQRPEEDDEDDDFDVILRLTKHEWRDKFKRNGRVFGPQYHYMVVYQDSPSDWGAEECLLEDDYGEMVVAYKQAHGLTDGPPSSVKKKGKSKKRCPKPTPHTQKAQKKCDHSDGVPQFVTDYEMFYERGYYDGSVFDMSSETCTRCNENFSLKRKAYKCLLGCQNYFCQPCVSSGIGAAFRSTRASRSKP